MTTRRRGRRPSKVKEMARRLLRGAGLGYHPDAAARVIATAPANAEEARHPDPAASFCAACLCAWERKPMGGGEYEEFTAVAGYWLDERPGRTK